MIATAARLLDGRFTLGVGTGQALNEHILGDAWPEVDVRLEMLEEAEVIRGLWQARLFSHRGPQTQAGLKVCVLGSGRGFRRQGRAPAVAQRTLEGPACAGPRAPGVFRAGRRPRHRGPGT